MVSSEFGRTPKINKDAGRDHWPKVFSVVLAGGGIKKGYDLRHVGRDRQRAGATTRSAVEDLAHDRLPPARHRRRQGADGPRQPADRDRRRRQGASRNCWPETPVERSREARRPPSQEGGRRAATVPIRAARAIGTLPTSALRETSHRSAPDRRSRPCDRLIARAASVLSLPRSADPASPRRARAASPSLRRSGPAAASAGPRSRSPSAAPGSADAQEILFYQPGITVDEARGRQRQPRSRRRSRSPPTARSACTTSGSARRPASASCGRFSVGALPDVDEVEPNNDFAKPQPIPMNVTVNGVADNEDVDYFVVEAKKGERITAEVEGIRLGHHALRPLRRDPRREAVRAGHQRRRGPGLAGRRSPRSSPPRTARTSSRSARAPTRATAPASIGCTSATSPGRRRPSRPAASSARRSTVRWIGDVPGETTTERDAARERPTATSACSPRTTRGSPPIRTSSGSRPFGNVDRGRAERRPRRRPRRSTAADGAQRRDREAGRRRPLTSSRRRRGRRYDVRVFARRLRSPLDSVLYDRQARAAARSPATTTAAAPTATSASPPRRTASTSSAVARPPRARAGPTTPTASRSARSSRS